MIKVMIWRAYVRLTGSVWLYDIVALKRDKCRHAWEIREQIIANEWFRL
jgi:hypothetical protein